MEADNFERKKNKLKEKNEKNTTDMTLLKKGYNFFSRKLSEDREGEKVYNFGQNKTSPEKQTDSSVPKYQANTFNGKDSNKENVSKSSQESVHLDKNVKEDL